jgi:hypothetical protein
MHQEYQQYTNNNIVRYINAILTCRSLQEVHNNFRQSISHQLLLLFHIVWLAEIEPTYMQMHQEWIHQWHINIVVIFYLNCTGSAEQILTEQHQFLLFCFILFGYQ